MITEKLVCHVSLQNGHQKTAASSSNKHYMETIKMNLITEFFTYCQQVSNRISSCVRLMQSKRHTWLSYCMIILSLYIFSSFLFAIWPAMRCHSCCKVVCVHRSLVCLIAVCILFIAFAASKVLVCMQKLKRDIYFEVLTFYCIYIVILRYYPFIGNV